MTQAQGELVDAVEDAPSADEVRPPKRRRRAVAAASLVAASLGALAWGQHLWTLHDRFRAGLPWILGGLALAAAARRVCRAKRSIVRGRWSRLDWAAVVLITIAAGAIRFPKLETLPPGGFYDEAQNGIVGREILAGARPVFVAGATQMPALFFYLVAAALEIAGDDLISIRLLSALLGTMAAPVFYLFARRVAARPVAIAAAVLFAGSRWHLTFSRVGFTGIFNPLLELLAAYFLVRALETGRRRHFAALGVTVGVGLQTYYAFNLFPIVLLGILAARGLRSPRPRLMPVARGLGLAVLAALIVLAPLVAFAIREPDTFFQRTNTVVVWNPDFNLPFPQIVFDHVRYHLQMFNFVGDVNARHNIPDAPQLGFVAGLLFLLGFGAVLARPLTWPNPAWLVWWGVMLLPGILTIEAPQAYRTIGVVPAVYLVTAQGIALLTDLGRGTRGLRRALRWAVVVVALVAAAQDVDTYFRRQAPSQAAWDAHDSDHTEAARFVDAHAGRYAIWVTPLHGDYPVFRFRVLGRYRSFIASDHFPLDPGLLDARDEGALYVLQPFEADLEPLFRALYPHAALERHLDPFGRVSFVSVVVPREDLRRAHDPRVATGGLTAVFYANDEWRDEPAVVRRDPAVLFHYHSEPLPDPFTVDWSASVQVTTPGEHEFELVATGPALLRIDDTVVIAQSDFPPEHRRVGGRLWLAAGDHRMLVRYHEASYLSTVRLWWRPPGQDRPSVIPLAALRPLPLETYRAARGAFPRP